MIYHLQCQRYCHMLAHRIDWINIAWALEVRWPDPVSTFTVLYWTFFFFIFALYFLSWANVLEYHNNMSLSCHWILKLRFTVHGSEINKSYLEKNRSDLSIGDMSAWFQGKDSSSGKNATQDKQVLNLLFIQCCKKKNIQKSTWVPNKQYLLTSTFTSVSRTQCLLRVLNRRAWALTYTISKNYSIRWKRLWTVRRNNEQIIYHPIYSIE